MPFPPVAAAPLSTGITAQDAREVGGPMPFHFRPRDNTLAALGHPPTTPRCGRPAGVYLTAFSTRFSRCRATVRARKRGGAPVATCSRAWCPFRVWPRWRTATTSSTSRRCATIPNAEALSPNPAAKQLQQVSHERACGRVRAILPRKRWAWLDPPPRRPPGSSTNPRMDRSRLCRNSCDAVPRNPGAPVHAPALVYVVERVRTAPRGASSAPGNGTPARA